MLTIAIVVMHFTLKNWDTKMFVWTLVDFYIQISDPGMKQSMNKVSVSKKQINKFVYIALCI